MEGCLVLDFDGTILDTEEPVYVSWAELWADHGERLVRSDWQQIIGTQSGFDPWHELERRLGRPLLPDLEATRRSRRDELTAPQRPRTGILDWLDQADELGVATGIASSSPFEWVLSHLDRLGLMDRFATVVCADDDVPAKPDPTSYRLVCDALGANPALSVAVEDSPHGIAAARRAGLYTVAVPHGLTEDMDLSAAQTRLVSLDQLTLGEALRAARRRIPD